MNHERFLSSLLAAVLAFVLAALWLTRFTYADGALWEYAVLSGDYASLRSWLRSAYWYLPYCIVLGIKWLEELGWSHVLSIKLLDSVLLLAYAHEVKRWSQDVLKFDSERANCCAVLMVLIGPWYFLTNYFAISQLICIYFGLLGHRLLWASRSGVQWVGLAVCILAFQLNSNLVFVLALQAVRLYTQPRITCSMWAWTLAVVAASVGVYAVLRFGVPRGQLHLSYNELLWPTNKENIKKIAKCLAMFGTWAAYPLAALMLVFLLPRKPAVSHHVHSDALSLLSIHQKLGVVAVLMVAAAFPYVMVGKGFALFTPTFFGQGLTERTLREAYEGWYLAPTYSSTSARHTLMLAFPLAVFSVLAVDRLACYKKQAFSALQTFLVIALLPALFAVGGYWNRLSQMYVHEQLVLGLRALPEPPAGVIEVAYTPKSDWLIWVADGNLMARRAWGKSHFFSMIYSTSAYADDLKWQYHALYKNLKNKIPEDDLQGMAGMNGFPDEACLTKYQATLPPASWWQIMLGQWIHAYLKPAIVQTISSDCVVGRVIVNPKPNKVVIP